MRARTVRLLVVPFLLAGTSGCLGYRLVRPEEIEVPNYEPRPVLVPASCDALVQRAATQGVGAFTEADARLLDFCQGQQLIRAQEEEAAARKLEAHAETANFVLRASLVAVGGLVAVLSWLF